MKRLASALFILALAFLAGRLVAVAQPVRTERRIGVLCSAWCTPEALASFRQGLRARGWLEGQNLSIESRHDDADMDRLIDGAYELGRLNVEVVLAIGPSASRAATRTLTRIPVVAGMSDPVALGISSLDLSRPPRYVTGVNLMWAELGGKRLELLREVVPRISRVAVLWPRGGRWVGELQPVAIQHGMSLRRYEAESLGEIDQAFAAMVLDGVAAVVVGPDELFFLNRARIAALADRSRLPVVYEVRDYVTEAGGLMSYGSSLPAIFQQSAALVARILEGAKPSELPIEQPMRLELVINLRAAKALGLTIPQSVLLRADEVIQ